jgi:hypothetical protein
MKYIKNDLYITLEFDIDVASIQLFIQSAY